MRNLSDPTGPTAPSEPQHEPIAARSAARPPRNRPIGRLKLLALLAAAGLVASACGSESGTATVDAATPAAETEAPTSTADEGGEAAGPTEPQGEGTQAEGPQPVESHLFPDLGTVNIIDGSSVNLAQQLAGGDTPVLLWFWAPH